MAAVMSGPLPNAVSRVLRSSYKTSIAGGLRHKSTPATLVNNNVHGTAAGGSAAPIGRDDLDLTFCDHEKAFKSKTNWEIMRALLIFNLCGIKPLVDNNMKVSSILTVEVYVHILYQHILLYVHNPTHPNISMCSVKQSPGFLFLRIIICIFLIFFKIYNGYFYSTLFVCNCFNVFECENPFR